MARYSAHDANTDILEKGAVHFVYRGGDEAGRGSGRPAVERFHMVLHPEGGRLLRLTVIGRKRLPTPDDPERNWGFVQSVCASPAQATALLSEHRCRLAAQGAYAFLRLGATLRLIYAIDHPAAPGRLQSALNIGTDSAMVVSITPPERRGPAPEDARDPRRLLPHDPGLLDFEGTEFVLISADERAPREPSPDPAPEAAEAAEVARILRQLRFAHARHPVAPLLPGVLE